MECQSCEVLYITGAFGSIKCHEHGCVDAWIDEKRECKWCGSEFTPKERGQVVCDDSCAEAYFR